MAGGPHVLAIGDEVVLAKLRDRRETTTGAQPTAKEVAQIVAVAAHGRGGEVGATGARRKKRLAACLSRLALSRKSTVCPVPSTAR